MESDALMISLKLLRAEAKRVFGPRACVDTGRFVSAVEAYVLPDRKAGVKFRKVLIDSNNQATSRELLLAALKGLPSC